MKAMTKLVAMLLGLVLIAVPSGIAGKKATITLDGRLATPYMSERGGMASLQISLWASHWTDDRTRRPMNIAVVLDRSGSMGHEQKMDHAKSALRTIIHQLSSDDIFSLVVYDNEVDVLRPAGRVRNKNHIITLVEEIYPRGSTNLGGGMSEGLKQAARHASREYVNRVILLSDGLANQGITDKNQLEQIAYEYRGRGISLTSMGVGLEYNEDLMMALAESGGGNYYFIESGYGLAGVLQKEFNSLCVTLVQDASVELKLGRGVRVEDVVGCKYTTVRDRVTIDLGSIISNDRRDITVRLSVPAQCDGEKKLLVAKGSLHYESEEVRIARVEPFEVSVIYTRDVAVIEKNRDMKAQADADVALSTRMVEQALKLLGAGKHNEAVVQMEMAETTLMASPAAAGTGESKDAVMEQSARLRSYKETVQSETDARKSKKTIQYHNYQTQKKK